MECSPSPCRPSPRGPPAGWRATACTACPGKRSSPSGHRTTPAPGPFAFEGPVNKKSLLKRESTEGNFESHLSRSLKNLKHLTRKVFHACDMLMVPMASVLKPRKVRCLYFFRRCSITCSWLPSRFRKWRYCEEEEERCNVRTLSFLSKAEPNWIRKMLFFSNL